MLETKPTTPNEPNLDAVNEWARAQLERARQAFVAVDHPERDKMVAVVDQAEQNVVGAKDE